MIRIALASVLWLVAGAASASPTGRGAAGPGSAAPAEHPAAAAPAPDSAGARGRPGPADRRRTVSLLDVRIEGMPEDVKDNFRRQLEEQIDTKRYWLADREYMRRLLLASTKWTDGCLVGRCLTAIRSSGAELVLLAALSGSGTSFGYVVTLIRTDTGHVIEHWTLHDLRRTFASGLQRLRYENHDVTLFQIVLGGGATTIPPGGTRIDSMEHTVFAPSTPIV